ncbi:Peptide hydrolase [Mycena chlorophos]|uniref:Peptide hydrolase n=1 Tax=Mycena chlorophos TaxID=658473 RepID=A0A8H6T9M3_MYCCL|nr:Peptide hydrolase [Mycena chlorophos]
MKSLLSLVALACVAAASPIADQVPLNSPHAFAHPDFPNFDLNAIRLVQFEDQSAPVQMTEWQKLEAKSRGFKYFDVTDTPHLGSSAQLRIQSVFPEPNATEKVLPILKTLSTKGPEENLRKFSSFRTRHYRSETGAQSQAWLVSKIAEVARVHHGGMGFRFTSREGQADGLTLKSFLTNVKRSPSPNSLTHGGRTRSSSESMGPPAPTMESLLLAPTRTARKSLFISISTISSDNFPFSNMLFFLPAPGADDDGSGSVTILESYRGLLAADFHPERAVEFHWYSAEEGGLLGSQAVAQHYEANNVNVIAMSQFDMTAWVKRGTREEVGIIGDFVDEGLTAFNKALVETYLDIPWVETKCGYACSDHASWMKAGYPSSFTIESSFENSNQNIHSTNDRIDVSDEFSFDHMLEFSKLAVAFAVELGGSK